MANTKITNPELFNLGDSTSATQLPVMTTVERIAMNPPTLNIDYLVVAGGGAGGGTGQAGGGGAGGLRTNYQGTSLSLNSGSTYTVTVGAGGSGTGTVGNSGSNSIFDYITSAGGGGGAPHNTTAVAGGSGGGGGTYLSNNGGNGNTPATPTSQGNAGGGGGGTANYAAPFSGGGGGGYGSAGSTGGNASGNGGAGIAYTAANSITGSALSLAGGGGGGTYNGTAGTATNGGGDGFTGTAQSTGSPGTPGTDNTGGGGGGTGNYQVGTIGASGGSGIVILRYPTADVASYTATGLTPTETTVGTDTVLSFTTVGTGTISFTSSTPIPMSVGEMIFNSTTDKVEYFDGTKWYGITYEVQPPTSLMYLDANNITSWPTTGSTWYDISGNNHNGAITGASYNSTEKGFQFNGSTSQYVNISNYSLNATKAFSVWIKPNDYSTRFPFQIGNGQNQETFIYLDNTFTTIRIGNAQARFAYNNTTSYYNVIGNVNSSNLVDLWINGVRVATSTANPVAVPAQTAYIGVRYNGSGFSQGYNGYLSKIQLYDITLTDSEIAALHAQGKGF